MNLQVSTIFDWLFLNTVSYRLDAWTCAGCAGWNASEGGASTGWRWRWYLGRLWLRRGRLLSREPVDRWEFQACLGGVVCRWRGFTWKSGLLWSSEFRFHRSRKNARIDQSSKAAPLTWQTQFQTLIMPPYLVPVGRKCTSRRNTYPISCNKCFWSFKTSVCEKCSWQWYSNLYSHV